MINFSFRKLATASVMGALILGTTACNRTRQSGEGQPQPQTPSEEGTAGGGPTGTDMGSGSSTTMGTSPGGAAGGMTSGTQGGGASGGDMGTGETSGGGTTF